MKRPARFRYKQEISNPRRVCNGKFLFKKHAVQLILSRIDKNKVISPSAGHAIPRAYRRSFPHTVSFQIIRYPASPLFRQLHGSSMFPVWKNETKRMQRRKKKNNRESGDGRRGGKGRRTKLALSTSPAYRSRREATPCESRLFMPGCS